MHSSIKTFQAPEKNHNIIETLKQHRLSLLQTILFIALWITFSVRLVITTLDSPKQENQAELVKVVLSIQISSARHELAVIGLN